MSDLQDTYAAYRVAAEAAARFDSNGWFAPVVILDEAAWTAAKAREAAQNAASAVRRAARLAAHGLTADTVMLMDSWVGPVPCRVLDISAYDGRVTAEVYSAHPDMMGFYELDLAELRAV